MAGAEKIQPAKLLSRAKEHIPGAYAIRKRRSNDTEVFVASASQRDAVLNMPQPENFQILRQDYPVEIPVISLSVKIEGGKNSNNASINQDIIAVTNVRVPGIQINRIRWLHDGKENLWAEKNGNTRGTVIMSLPSEALQKDIVRKGIVLNSTLFSAQMWSPRA